MKAFYSLFALMLSTSIVKANVLTVSNDGNRPAQYTSIVTAFNAAAAGDTIHLYGGPNSYGDLTITKAITIIGNGFNPRKENFYHSKLGSISLSGNVSNVTLDGLTFQQFIPNANSAVTYNNITLKNCYIHGEMKLLAFQQPPVCGLSIGNWLIQNCYIQIVNFGTSMGCSPISPITSGVLFKNCHITSIRNTHNAQFVNCQFGNNIDSGDLGDCRNCTFDNCIFLRFSFAQNSSTVNNVFHNCLTYQTQVPSANFDLNSWTNGGSGSATGCIINQNPLYVNSNLYRILEPTISVRIAWDPSMQAASPAINAGTDGTNIGISGGTTPFRISGEPNIPVVRKFQLINSVVPSNGTVTLKATATKAQ